MNLQRSTYFKPVFYEPGPEIRLGSGIQISGGRFAWLLFKTILISFALFLAGFFYFIYTINTISWTGTQKTDGIVVLTGGQHRISEAYGLVAAGYGKRLLISGVHESTNRDILQRVSPERRDILTCCVDLGYQAANTNGNAREAMEWVKKNDFHSLIVVTSNYHMPRSLAEIGSALKGVQIIPYPVSSTYIDTKNWWRSPYSVKLLGYEYIKYLYVLTRTTAEKVFI